MMRKLLLGAAIAVAACATRGRAQPAPPPPGGETPLEMQAMIQLAAHNQLGVLEYCHGVGAVDASAAAMQRRQLSAMPPAPAPNNEAAQAEAAGRQGVVESGGQRVSLAEAARQQNTTVPALCARIADMARQQLSAGQQPE